MERIQLVKDTIERDDVDALIEWLKGYPRLTKGALTWEYENKWAEWLGCEYAVFVNSGSSALLIMLQALKEHEQLRNNKIVIPQLAWATDLSSPMILGMEPILCDVNKETLSVDLADLERLFKEEEPAALMLVSVLGLSPQMDKIQELCERYEVILLEDNCESQGTTFNGVKLGNFGKMSAFSTYFGHSMSTIEGGMVCTNDEKYYKLLLQLRSHGWDRDLDESSQQELREKNSVTDFNALYTFYVPAFNLRATDLQAFLGMRQLDKIDDWLEQRNKNFKYITSSIADLGLWTPTEAEGSWTASFCYPMIFDTAEQRDNVVRAMLDEGVECRPLISGSMGTQPMYVREYGKYVTPNVADVDTKGMYMPNHPKLTQEELDKMITIIKDNI